MRSAPAARPPRRFPQPKLLTYADYARLTPPDSGNYELHNGKIVFTASPTPTHQEISSLLHTYLGMHILTNKLGKLFAAPMDTVFSEVDTLQPDLLLLPTRGSASWVPRKSKAHLIW